MSYRFETYQPRKIEFDQTLTVNSWKIKVYSITINAAFQSSQILDSAIKNLPVWLKFANASKLQTYNIAFLIVHEAREGVLVLLNWWTGGEMVETNIYFFNYNNPSLSIKSPYYPKALVCIWELQVFAHERKAWIEHVLLKTDNPDFENYLNDSLN